MIVINENLCFVFRAQTLSKLKDSLFIFIAALFNFSFMITELVSFEISSTKHCYFYSRYVKVLTKFPFHELLVYLFGVAHTVRHYLNGVRSFSRARRLGILFPLEAKSNVSHAWYVLLLVRPFSLDL